MSTSAVVKSISSSQFRVDKTTITAADKSESSLQSKLGVASKYVHQMSVPVKQVGTARGALTTDPSLPQVEL